jgi:regulator of protease activity HflC (stomatin/prohibitin superfamily)
MIGTIAGMLVGTALTSGVLIGSVGLAAPFFLKEQLKNDPDKPEKLALFTEIEQGRSKLIMRGGRVDDILHGEMDSPSYSGIGFWDWYKDLCWRVTGYHVVVPFFQKVYTYNLPRYRVRDEKGRKVFLPVSEGQEGYRSDHFRTQPTTWNFDFAGVDVERISFDVTGSVQYFIDKEKIRVAAFQADAWNILLDQALNSVIRGYVRGLLVDDILGRTSKDIWDDTRDTTKKASGAMQDDLLQQLKAYVLKLPGGDLTLADLGIVVLKVDLNDFGFSEGSDPQTIKRLQEAVVKKQEARGRSLEGQGEAERISKVNKALAENPDLAALQLETDALVRASKEGSILDALLTALTKNQLKGK